MADKTMTMIPRKNGGFSLVEMIVSIGLFSLLVLLVSTAFFYLTGVQRTVESKQQILNDFRLAIDVMTKEMTSGSAYPVSCDNGCQNIVFVTKPRPDMPQRRIEYRLNATDQVIEKAEQKTYGICATIPFDNDCFQPFHSGKVDVNSLTYYVHNKTLSYTQPAVTIEIDGTLLPGSKNEESFRISSSVTPRLLQDPSALPPSDNENPEVTITNPVTVASPQTQGTWVTGNSTISLGGLAEDNDVVSEVRWRNETISSTGLITSDLESWTTPNIPLRAGVDNTIVIEAWDPAGNSGIKTLIVTSTAVAAPPTTPTIDAFQECGAYIRISSSCVTGATAVYYYRCNTPGCTPTTYVGATGSCGTLNNSTSLSVGETYRYRAQARNGITGLSSGYSNIDEQMYNPPYSCDSGQSICYYGSWSAGGACGGGNCQSYQQQQTRTTSDPSQCPVTTQCVNVAACGTPPSSTRFTLVASPSIIRVRVSGSTGVYRQSQTSSIKVTPLPGFVENVALTLPADSGQPSGAAASFNPTSLTQETYGTGSTFYVTVPDNTPIGIYNMLVTGTSQSGYATTTTVVLDVAAVGGGQQ